MTDLADGSDNDPDGVAKMAEDRPGNGVWGWLGRQFGYVKKAVKADVTKEVIHRQQKVEEAKLPEQPNVTLRRTVIDEVIVDKRLPAPAPPPTKTPQQQENQP